MHLTLVMMVKNEAKNIRQTLDSVRGVVDSVSVLDTGSTDDTPQLIRQWCAACEPPVLYRIHEHPIVPYADTGIIDFAASRNLGLELAERIGSVPKDPWMLLLNGDDVLDDAGDLRGFLSAARPADEAFYVRVRGYIDGSFPSSRLVRMDRGWRYVLPTHEVICRDGVFVSGEAPCIIRQLESSGDRKPRWLQDRIVLQRYLEDNPGDHRALFYLGQTLSMLGEYELAAETYERRSRLGGWPEEVYEAFYRRARALEVLAARPDSGYVWGDVQQAYLEAHAARPTRAEPLHRIAAHWLGRNKDICHLFARAGADLPLPSDSCPTVEEDVYSWRMHDLVGISAYYTRHRDEGAAACEEALRACPQDQLLRVHRNRSFYTKSAREIFPGFETVEFQVELPEPYLGTNPCIWTGGDQGIFRRIMILRGVNFEPNVSGNNYIIRDSDQVCRTRNFWLDLDENYEVENVREILDVSGRPVSKYPVHGYEDLRLVRDPAGMWVATCTVCDAADRGDSRATGQRCEIGLLKIIEPEVGIPQIVDCTLLRGSWSGYFQKNWLPLVDGSDLKFIYNTDPLVVLAAGLDTLRRVDGGGIVVPEPSPPHGLRGSSQAIKLIEGWLWVVHEVSFEPSGGSRMYQERFVLANHALTEVLGVSPPFHLHPEPGIEFVCGLAQDDDRLLISYGERDKRAKLGIIRCSQVLDTLDSIR